MGLEFTCDSSLYVPVSKYCVLFTICAEVLILKTLEKWKRLIQTPLSREDSNQTVMLTLV